jgi:hypothetical protein
MVTNYNASTTASILVDDYTYPFVVNGSPIYSQLLNVPPNGNSGWFPSAPFILSNPTNLPTPSVFCFHTLIIYGTCCQGFFFTLNFSAIHAITSANTVINSCRSRFLSPIIFRETTSVVREFHTFAPRLLYYIGVKELELLQEIKIMVSTSGKHYSAWNNNDLFTLCLNCKLVRQLRK